ncbi:substrate-binding domain-containing protein [Amycolatopsis aidingensis]|uniref:substrate-binding domain-containing protein n=1 Tax=Amycolatopsis aidingensis TaxID=2842453 RepID=UPI001C0E7E87|nr:substrate-binding domain-containing protein [Amycolatopsis aidingensis]
MRETSEARRDRIAAIVRSRGSVRVRELATELEVSVVTARRDVEELARVGRLRRGHGVARSLTDRHETGGDGPLVALVIPERHTYLHETMNGARAALEEAGLRVALHIVPRLIGADRPIVEQALADGACGLVIAPHWRTAAAEAVDHAWLADTGVPTVLMERRPRRGNPLYTMDSACSDHWYGMHLAVDHLLALGHRRIVLAARDDSPTARALRRAFTGIVATRVQIQDWTVLLSVSDEGPAPLATVLRERAATAAVLHSDEDALMLVQQLTDEGLRVPQDCSVVAYDDVVAGLGSVPLTTVSPPKAEVGRVAAELLLRRLGEPATARPWPARRVELLPELTIRESTQRL